MYKSIPSLMSKRITLLLLIVCLFGVRESRASHATGGQLTYTFLGNGQYDVTFTFYRDCFGIPAPYPQQLDVNSVSCNFHQTFSMDTVGIPGGTGYEITQACSSVATTCGTGTAPGIQEWKYHVIVTLPAQCVDWDFSTVVNARNQAITTLVNASGTSLYVDAWLNNSISDNNSPTFSTLPIAFECIGQTNNFNPGVIDQDGDSLVFSFIAPRTAPNTIISYMPGYSIANPFMSSPPITINSSTGDMVMYPTQPDVAVVCVLCQEYRNGVIIGSVMRDMQIYIIPCTNTLPVLSGIDSTSNYSANMCVGGPLCFTVISNDADPGQIISMSWNQGIPGATFIIDSTLANPTGYFCWTPLPGDARPNPYSFTVTVRDNACPANGSQTYQFNITVSNMNVMLTSTPSVQCYGSHTGSAAAAALSGNPPITYVWTLPGSGGTITGPSSISHLNGGNYTLNVSDVSGCVTTTNFTIAEPAQLVTTITPTNSGCGGGSGSALANVTGGTPPIQDYLWSPAPGAGQHTPNATQLATGSYSVLVTDNHSCTSTASTNIIAIIPVNFTLNLTGATCLANDGSASVTHTGGVGPFSYQWTPDIPGNTTTSSLTGLITGVYSVVATDLGTGCSESLSGIVQNLSGLSASIVITTPATCENGEDGSATVLATGGQPPYSYLWPNGDTTVTTNHLPAGPFTVQVADYNGCLAYATDTIGFVHPAPLVELGPDTMPCIGTPYTMDAGPGMVSYLWSDASTSQTLTVNASGLYSVLVTNSYGCENSDAINVTFVVCMVHNNPGSGNNAVSTSVVNIYPNPANNELNVNVSRIRNTEVTLTMSDILGNNIYFNREVCDYGYIKKVDIHTLPAGIYMMRVEYAGEISTTRIIKQ